MREDSFFLNSLNCIFPLMPFTVSHAAAVIPLYKYLGKFGAFSALIIGSMMPDFAYLTPYLVDQRMDSHSLLGVYLYCLPMGLTIYFLYHLLMAPVIVSILPYSIQKHLSQDLFIGRLPNIPSYALILSIVIGALTHIFWDFFTHQTGLPQYIQWMNKPLTNIDGFDIMPYRMFQHFSSLFGLSLLLFWIWKWHQKKNGLVQSNNTESNLSLWRAPKKLKYLVITLLLIVPIIGGLINGFRYLPDTSVFYGLYGAQIFIKAAFFGAVIAFLVICLSFGLFYQYKIQGSSNN